MKLIGLPGGQGAIGLAFLFFTPLAQAALWTITEYVQAVRTTEFYTYTTRGTRTTDSEVYTATRTVKGGVTPTASPTRTATTYDYYFDDLVYVNLQLPAGAVGEDELVASDATRSTGNGTPTVYVQDVEYTAPASCPTPFTYTDQTTMTIPSEVAQTLTPTSFNTRLRTYPSTYSEVTAYLPPTAVTIPAASLTTKFTYSYYVAYCTNPATLFGSGSGSGSGSHGSNLLDDDDEYCSRRYSCISLRKWIIIIVSVVGGLFVLGFVESFFWFRALMRGRRAWRLGTICWIGISLWVYCITAITPARSPEDQRVLEEQWKQMGAGQRLRLWLKWGFRHKYPVDLLGPEPPRNQPVAKAAVANPAPVPAPGTAAGQQPVGTAPRDVERGEGAPEVRVVH